MALLTRPLPVFPWRTDIPADNDKSQLVRTIHMATQSRFETSQSLSSASPVTAESNPHTADLRTRAAPHMVELDNSRLAPDARKKHADIIRGLIYQEIPGLAHQDPRDEYAVALAISAAPIQLVINVASIIGIVFTPRLISTVLGDYEFRVRVFAKIRDVLELDSMLVPLAAVSETRRVRRNNHLSDAAIFTLKETMAFDHVVAVGHALAHVVMRPTYSASALAETLHQLDLYRLESTAYTTQSNGEYSSHHQSHHGVPLVLGLPPTADAATSRPALAATLFRQVVAMRVSQTLLRHMSIHNSDSQTTHQSARLMLPANVVMRGVTHNEIRLTNFQKLLDWGMLSSDNDAIRPQLYAFWESSVLRTSRFPMMLSDMFGVRFGIGADRPPPPPEWVHRQWLHDVLHRNELARMILQLSSLADRAEREFGFVLPCARCSHVSVQMVCIDAREHPGGAALVYRMKQDNRIADTSDAAMDVDFASEDVVFTIPAHTNTISNDSICKHYVWVYQFSNAALEQAVLTKPVSASAADTRNTTTTTGIPVDTWFMLATQIATFCGAETLFALGGARDLIQTSQIAQYQFTDRGAWLYPLLVDVVWGLVWISMSAAAGLDVGIMAVPRDASKPLLDIATSLAARYLSDIVGSNTPTVANAVASLSAALQQDNEAARELGLVQVNDTHKQWILAHERKYTQPLLPVRSFRAVFADTIHRYNQSAVAASAHTVMIDMTVGTQSDERIEKQLDEMRTTEGTYCRACGRGAPHVQTRPLYLTHTATFVCSALCEQHMRKRHSV